MDLKEKITSIPKPILKAAGLGFILGILWFMTFKVVFYDFEGTHYHANFAVYIDGERELFEERTFYEEVNICGGEGANPLARVHMHDFIPDVVHVHDDTATWSNFMANIGFTLGNTSLSARGETYVDGTDGELMFILNGDRVRDIANKIIGDEDRLLISFDKSSDVLEEQFDQVDQTAAEYNEKQDPSACSGSGEAPAFVDRFKDVINFD